MADRDTYIPLPDDDEQPAALLDTFEDALSTLVPGWQPSDAALEVAMAAAFCDEQSVLYALLREEARDRFRDYGVAVLDVAPVEPWPASTTTTWVARAPAPAGGYEIAAGVVLVVDAPQGRVAFETTDTTTIGVGVDRAAGVTVQALEPGSAANLATGDVVFDEPPAWVQTVTVDAPAIGGTDSEDDDAHLARIRRAAQLLSRAPILPRDFELVAQEIPEVERALVRDLYDEQTGLAAQDGVVSIYPITAAGAACSTGGKQAVHDLIVSRCLPNTIVRIGNPTLTTISVDITVTALEGADLTAVQAAVTGTIRDVAVNPALWGQPPFGERRSFRRRTVVRRYEVAATADRAGGVDEVTVVRLNGADADVVLAGSAPLPQPGVITVTVLPAP